MHCEALLIFHLQEIFKTNLKFWVYLTNRDFFLQSFNQINISKLVDENTIL